MKEKAGEIMATKEGETRLNVDIPKFIKRRLDVFCALKNKDLKVVTAQALEFYLDAKNAPKIERDDLDGIG